MEKIKIIALLCILVHTHTLLAMYKPTSEILYCSYCQIAEQPIIQAQINLRNKFTSKVPFIITVVKQLKSKKFYAQVSKSRIALYLGYREKGDGIVKGFHLIDPRNIKKQTFIGKEYAPYIKKLVTEINSIKKIVLQYS